MPARFDHG